MPVAMLAAHVAFSQDDWPNNGDAASLGSDHFDSNWSDRNFQYARQHDRLDDNQRPSQSPHEQIEELSNRVTLLEQELAKKSLGSAEIPATNTGLIQSAGADKEGKKPDNKNDKKPDKGSGSAAQESDSNKDAADEWKDISDEKWTVKFGGHVQLDYINWVNAGDSIPGTLTKDYFEFRRLRLVADGSGYGLYDFRLQMTLEPETVGETQPLGTVTSPDVKDAYFSINEIPYLGRFRIGNFFVPFSLEQVTNDTNNVFMERSIPTQGIFAADREVGIALYNASADQNFTWTTGVFFDSISDSLKERIDDNQGIRLSGRLTWLPFYDDTSNGRYLVHTGMGILYTDDQDKIVRFRARPQIHEGPRLIDSGPLAANSFTSANIEGAIVWGSVSLQGEAFLSQVNMQNGDHPVVNGAYVTGSFFPTGENRIFDRFGQHGAQFARNVPINNVFFVPGGMSLGGLELKARWSRLDLNRVHAGQYNDISAGFNWYFSQNTRAMCDWIHPILSSQTVFGASSSDILALRFDFNW